MTLRLKNNSLSLRSITESDEETLCQIYSSTRTEELARVLQWTNNEKKEFLQMQFKAQHHYYQKNYTGANFWIIESSTEVVGRLYLQVNHGTQSMRIIDITLLPNWRNKGIGQQVLRDVMEYATSRNRSITIHVESFNPAMKLYKKLGFELVDVTNGVYYLLEWKNKDLILQ